MATFPAPALTAPYLIVALGDVLCGIPVCSVREILHLRKISPFEQPLPQVRGVIELHDRLVPVLDLRQVFGMPASFGRRSCFVMVQTCAGAVDRQTALLVDSVEAVTAIGKDLIAAPADFVPPSEETAVFGVVNTGGCTCRLLDVERLVVGKLGRFAA